MEEKKIIKPPFWLSLQLFFFMMLTFWNVRGLISNLNGYWWDNISLIPIRDFIIAWCIDFIAYLFCFVSIYKALQHKAYSVTMLKFGVAYVLIQQIFRSLNYIGVYIPYLSLLYLPIIVFCLIFLAYLYSSKKLKLYIPPKDRTFGKYGLWGLAIYALVLFQYCYLGYNYFDERKNSLRAEIDKVSIKPGQITDGLAIYTPLQNWEKDSVCGDAKHGFTICFEDAEHNPINVASFNDTKCNNRVDYYLVLSHVCKLQGIDTNMMQEIAYSDTLINNQRYFSNTYKMSHSKAPLYWTFSAIVPNNSHKILTLSYLEEGDFRRSVENSKRFMQSVSFDLKE